jgi:hypothetical protein
MTTAKGGGFLSYTKIYRTDGDASNNHAVVLESIDGKSYFIPLLKRPELHDSVDKIYIKNGEIKTFTKHKNHLLSEGELITVSTYQSQSGRLTPVFLKCDIKSMQKEIAKNNYSGPLSSEIKQKTIFQFGGI